MMAAEGPSESMFSSDEEVEWKGKRGCTVRDCVCYWHSYGSPQTPRVAPGTGCFCIPDGADHSPAWSLIVGVKDGAALRLRRLRVARSGRIFGRSDDELEFFHDIEMPTEQGFSASAALASDGRSLCVLHQADEEKPQALQLTLEPQTADTDELHLPEIQETSHCILISTGGQFWALSATVDHGFEFSVLRRRLVPGDGWQQVGEACTSPHIREDFPVWGRWFLQGYAVLPLPDAKLILISFKQNGLFFTFALDSGDWTRVHIDATRLRDYVPILGRGVYIEQDQAVYMLRDNTIYAYKLSYCKDDDQGSRQLRLDPPIKIDSVCPFSSCEGYGFLACLNDRLMCSVWISLAWREPCLCDNLHAIVTTFHLDGPDRGGIKVLHSSFRRVDMKPNPEDQEFCFLMAYEDMDSPVLPQHEGQEDLTSSQHVDDTSRMLDCCRRNLTQKNAPRMCYLCGGYNHIAGDCSLLPDECASAMPPWGPTPSMPADSASMPRQVSFPIRRVATLKPATTTINKHLFIICQIGSQLAICRTGIMDESLLLEGVNGIPLELCYAADDDDDYWHFYHSGSEIHAVSSIRGKMLEFSLNKDQMLPIKQSVRRPRADPFVMVIRIGKETIALTDTLQVFHQKVFKNRSATWWRYPTNQSHVLRRKVLISGYVQVNDHSFIVWDAVTCSCLLCDLKAKQWRVVMPWAAFEDDLPRTNPRDCILNGRCVFVDGFIYTCSNGGLSAYQLLHKDHSVYLSKPIFLPFSWSEYCVGEDMCLDYAGKDVESGAILFYVVQGGCAPPENDVHIFIVKVKTKRTPSNKMGPVGVGLVDHITRSSRQSAFFYPRCCFAVSL